MKKIFRIGSAAVAAVLLLGLISCSNEVKNEDENEAFLKEVDGLLDEIKYEGTLGGKGTKDDPYIVKGQYTIKMPEAIDKGDHKICVQEDRGELGISDNFNRKDDEEGASPLLADYTFEATCRVVTMKEYGSYFYDNSWPSKTFYFKVPHITDENAKEIGQSLYNASYNFSADGKKLECIRSYSFKDSSSDDYYDCSLKLSFDVKPEEDGNKGSNGITEHYCTFTLTSCEYLPPSSTEWQTITKIPAILKKPTKFSYSTSYEQISEEHYNFDKFFFSEKYVWDDEKPLSENLAFCSCVMDGDNYLEWKILGDEFYVIDYVDGKDEAGYTIGIERKYTGKFDSAKTTFTGNNITSPNNSGVPTSFTGEITEEDTYGNRILKLKIDDKDYTLKVRETTIPDLAVNIMEIMNEYEE